MSTQAGGADEDKAGGAAPKAGGKAERYLDPNIERNRSIVEGFAGVYKVIKTLGSGAEGVTYLVEDANNGSKWAIKLIKLPLPTRFVQAIFRCASCTSPSNEAPPRRVCADNAWSP